MLRRADRHAGALEEVLLRAGPAVIQGENLPAVREHGRDSCPALVPRAGSGFQRRAMHDPGEAIEARAEPRAHSVGLVVAVVERVPARPDPPGAVLGEIDDDVLPRDRVIAGQDDGARAHFEIGQGVGIDCLDPPSAWNSSSSN